jgi:cysteine-rich repeat protein
VISEYVIFAPAGFEEVRRTVRTGIFDRLAIGGLCTTVLISACMAPVEDDDPELADQEHDAIVGGAEEYGFPMVGMLAANMGGGLSPFCTATPVTPTVLITAAHCTDAFTDFGNNISFARLSPDGRGPTYRVNAGSRRTHPNWLMYDACRFVFDIAVVGLQEPIDEDMFPEMHDRALNNGDRGTPIKVVGYGVSRPPDSGAGTKRSIDMQVTDLVTDYVWAEYGCTSPPRPYNYQYYTMVLGDYYNGVCYGDSGGPSFVVGENRDIQYGVHARTQVEECGPAEDTAVGYFYENFVRPNVLALDPTAENCGDGVCTGLERESTCAQDCSPFNCGDGRTEGPEVCDDGNTNGGDGCSSDCRSNETCGNNVTDDPAGEVCDDGNTNGGDGCSSDCRSNESCGNGVTDSPAGEVCDDGNTNGGDGCSPDCRSNEVCGNGITDFSADEACDDGNRDEGDGCSSDCRSDETCGNGVVDFIRGEV